MTVVIGILFDKAEKGESPIILSRRRFEEYVDIMASVNPYYKYNKERIISRGKGIKYRGIDVICK